MQQHATQSISAAQDAGLIKKVQSFLDIFIQKKQILSHILQSKKDGTQRKVYFEFIFQSAILTASFSVYSNSELISKSELRRNNILILTEGITSEEVKKMVDNAKQFRIKGYQLEDKVIGLLRNFKNEFFQIDDIIQATEFQDKIQKIDILLKINYFTKNIVNQKIEILVPIQLKSSSQGQSIHKEEHPNIPSIVFYENLKPEDMAEMIKKIIKNYTHFFFMKEVDPEAKPGAIHL